MRKLFIIAMAVVSVIAFNGKDAAAAKKNMTAEEIATTIYDAEKRMAETGKPETVKITYKATKKELKEMKMYKCIYPFKLDDFMNFLQEKRGNDIHSEAMSDMDKGEIVPTISYDDRLKYLYTLKMSQSKNGFVTLSYKWKQAGMKTIANVACAIKCYNRCLDSVEPGATEKRKAFLGAKEAVEHTIYNSNGSTYFYTAAWKGCAKTVCVGMSGYLYDLWNLLGISEHYLVSNSDESHEFNLCVIDGQEFFYDVQAVGDKWRDWYHYNVEADSERLQAARLNRGDEYVDSIVSVSAEDYCCLTRELVTESINSTAYDKNTAHWSYLPSKYNTVKSRNYRLGFYK